MLIINQTELTVKQEEEIKDIMRAANANSPSAFRVTSYKITPAQLEEIEGHLMFASWILNTEEPPDWEDLQKACWNIADALNDLATIREKVG